MADRAREGRDLEQEREKRLDRTGHTSEHPEDPEGQAPEVAGGVVGAAAGASMGLAGGPVGAVIGALAGAVGGWWATDKITGEMDYTDDEDRWCRGHFETPEYRLADRSYEDVRPAYVFGHYAGRNPAYRGRSFAEVEAELERDWARGLRERHGEWPAARRYAQASYERVQRQTFEPQ